MALYNTEMLKHINNRGEVGNEHLNSYKDPYLHTSSGAILCIEVRSPYFKTPFIRITETKHG
jgi:hypothetical protein